MRLYISITKSKSSASSIAVPSTFAIHLLNGAHFLNTTCISPAAVIVISPLPKMKASLQSQRLDSNLLYYR